PSAARASASASSSVAGPSSRPGSRWQWRSIISGHHRPIAAVRRRVERVYDRGRAARAARAAPFEHPQRASTRRMMFRSIVVGTDGSETASEAVRQAVDLASSLGASIELVSAYEPVSAQRLAQERRETPEDMQWAISP